VLVIGEQAAVDGAALRDRLDELFVPATEQRRNATA
jgi:hypothetical protein